MPINTKLWNKKELQAYILLTCANADSNLSKEELEMIKSKVDKDIFEKIYVEFSKDSEQKSLDKIDDNIHHLDYDNKELAELRREMYDVFFADCNFKQMERNLDRILDNILY